MVRQWETVDVLAVTFALSRSEVRRKLAEGAFYIKGDGWERIGPDDVLEADGSPAVTLLRFGKRRIEPAVLRW